MGALRRPDLSAGPLRDLNEALHELHHRSGWPSLRTLAAEVGTSRTTISNVFSEERLPTWGVLELLVEAMSGDVAAFRELWQRAGTAVDGGPDAPRAALAGRRTELGQVRIHLERGVGLLVVAGEAGIGKSRLVDVAVQSSGIHVADAPCLPQSVDAPLMPVADALRETATVDGGAWFEEALRACPAYVEPTLAVLLPELPPSTAAQGDPWSRHRLFSAITALLGQLVERAPLALAFDDLHWADTMTLEFLSHLVARGPALPVVGTWRTDDPDVGRDTLAWWARIRRFDAVNSIQLHPLDEAGTAEQLRLLTGVEPAATTVRRIHARSQGQPLFTEQLALHTGVDDLPDLLADVLDQRLLDLEPDSWTVARFLGVADRALSDAALADATGLDLQARTAALHELRDRRLLDGHRAEVELAHPLLAEAIRRRAVPGELEDTHRRLATTLADSGNASPAEIAQHWRGAGEVEAELTWRVRAARSAAARFATRQEWTQWRRALQLWPADLAEAGDPPVRQVDALLAAHAAAEATGDLVEGGSVVERALTLPGLSDPDRARALACAGAHEGSVGDPQRGLTLIDEAIALQEAQPSLQLVDSLNHRATILRGLGRHTEATQSVVRAVDVATSLGDLDRRRRMLANLAWQENVNGNLERALDLARQAAGAADASGDPYAEIELAITHTDMLLMNSAPIGEIEKAAQVGLEAAERWSLSTFASSMLRANVAEALLRAGQLGRAAELVDPVTEEPPAYGGWAEHLIRVELDACRGRLPAARERLQRLGDFPLSQLTVQLDVIEKDAMLSIFERQPGAALERLEGILRTVLRTEHARHVGFAMILLARARADAAAQLRLGSYARKEQVEELERLRSEAVVDPFGPHLTNLQRRALSSRWVAELGRLAGESEVTAWVHAASASDALDRPHNAAYCRWRAGQVAITEKQADLAARLLRRARTDAGQHVVLAQVISETRARLGDPTVRR